MLSGMDRYPSPQDHTYLLLPFTLETFNDPSPLFPTIFNTLQQSSLKSIAILCTTPPEALGGPQLYDVLRRDPRGHWQGMQRFLGGIYATLAAAQWHSGRVLMDVEVSFDTAEALAIRPETIENGQTIVFEGGRCLTCHRCLLILHRVRTPRSNERVLEVPSFRQRHPPIPALFQPGSTCHFSERLGRPLHSSTRRNF
jgi:hypothetical protein